MKLGTHPKLDLSRPRLMAIVNATPDSFSDGGLLGKDSQPSDIDRDKMARRIQTIVAEGADIIDIGGESTRPGAASVSVQEEMDRVIPVVEYVAQETRLAISVDTSSPEVMLEAAAKGAHLINDVRALSKPGALAAAAGTGLPVCLMHMQGMPSTMQDDPSYSHVVTEVNSYLQERVAACLSAEISPSNIMVDPGFGFGKTLEHNLTLLRQLPEIASLGFPVLVGLSRKSMIGHILKREPVKANALKTSTSNCDVDDRLPASLGLALMALERGAKILRVHDVQATRDIIDTFIAVKG